MNGNTAIFYDVENLLKGYSSSKSYIGNVSLTAIFQEIQKLEIVERIIIQKAYANWSDPRLSIMKREINELGIDPIQIFGFSYYQKKNAADIQLAVDSIDLAYVRENIDIFVIVSGDGGFSAVAKKLHEYGKYVVGCGYKSSTNQILASVCDYFIGINDPEDLEEDKTEIENLKITNPIVLRMSQSMDRLATNSREEILKQSLKIIHWFIQDAESARELSHNGLYLSVIKEAFKYGIEDFNSTKIGLSKFVHFLQFICRNTDLKVVTSSTKSETKIAFINTYTKGFEPLPYLDENYLHSQENYKSILATGNPRIRIIELEDFYKIISFVASLKNKMLTLDRLLEEINNSYPQIESVNINYSIYSLAAVDIFDTPEPDKNISEQFFYLKPQYFEREKILERFKEAIEAKLLAFWGDELKPDVIQQILYNHEC